MKKLGLILSLIVLTAVLIVGFTDNVVKASILGFSPNNCYTAGATTSPTYLSPGATSTVTCNMSPDGARNATLAIEVNASSTTVFNFNVEESMDGKDWFPVALNQNASTTAPFTLTSRHSFSLTFASSTIGGIAQATGLLGVNGTNNRNHYVADIPVRMKQVRVYATLPAGTTNGAVWMNIIPRQDIN